MKKTLFGMVLLTALLSAALFFTVRRNVAAMTAAIAAKPVTIVIDAGHGGEDGGAVGVSGVTESQLNLSVALRLEQLLAFCGYETSMIRREDCAVYTEGETISEKKVSDLKNRVQLVAQADPAVLISIHQNHFSQAQYSGAQVFYAPIKGSEQLAGLLQTSLRQALNPENRRMAKQAQSVYLLEQIRCPGVLVECGFLSNFEEEALLRQPEYQKKLVCAIACGLAQYLGEGAGEDEV